MTEVTNKGLRYQSYGLDTPDCTNQPGELAMSVGEANLFRIGMNYNVIKRILTNNLIQ